MSLLPSFFMHTGTVCPKIINRNNVLYTTKFVRKMCKNAVENSRKMCNTSINHFERKEST